MIVAGLVVTLSDLVAMQVVAMELLATDRRTVLGELQPGGRLPLATCTDTLAEQQDLWNEIARTPGVLLVELAYQDASDTDTFTSRELPSRWRREEP